jgi:hypothetical protein
MIIYRQEFFPSGDSLQYKISRSLFGNDVFLKSDIIGF